MTKQTDYTVEKVYDSFDKTTSYYVHTPEFDTEDDAEKLRQKILDNQKIVHIFQGAGMSFFKCVLSPDDMEILKILFDEKSMKLLEYLTDNDDDDSLNKHTEKSE